MNATKATRKGPFNFTKSEIDKLPLPSEEECQAIYFDTGLPGLGLRVSYGGTKTYFAEGRLNGKKQRVTIGKHPIYVPGTVSDTDDRSARKRASQILLAMSAGTDHKAVKSEKKAKATTLGTIFEKFMGNRKDLRPATQKVYRSSFTRCFSDWLSKPVTEITKDMVERRYDKLLNTDWRRGTDGVAQSHQAMRILRTVLNYASATLEDSKGKSVLPENPVRRLSQARLWQPVAERNTYIKPADLERWYGAVLQLDNDTMRDYLLMLLFTGLRRSECAKLEWTHIDFKARMLTIPAQNAKNNRAHKLPLSSFTEELLRSRWARRMADKTRKENPYVFPGSGRNNKTHLVESRYAITAVIEHSAVDDLPPVEFGCHDLRRSFLTYGESLDVPYLALKRLANHKEGDITSKYIVGDVERLREPLEKITAYIKAQAGIKEDAQATTGKVVAMARR